MYQVTEKKDGKYTIYELTDSAAHSWLKVAPERGGIILGLGVQGEEVVILK